MRKIGVCAAIAVTAFVFSSSPGAAFGLNLGPFHLYLPVPGPFFGHRHHVPASDRFKALHDEAELNSVAPAQGLTSPLLYPVLASPGVFDDVFWPSSSSWPFTYDAVFQTAFAQSHAAQDFNPCQQPDRTRAIIGRIQSEIRPTAAQMQQLQKLGGALAYAVAYLQKSCPTEVPAPPAARLQLMEWQIEKVAEALDIVRQPLQNFQQSLTDQQRARFAAMRGAPTIGNGHNRPGNIAEGCATATGTDWPIDQISLAVDPTDAQRRSLETMKQTFSNAATELNGYCATATPADPLARLEATEARLDATWRAVLSIQVALSSFEKGLNDQQRARLDATDLVAAR